MTSMLSRLYVTPRPSVTKASHERRGLLLHGKELYEVVVVSGLASDLWTRLVSSQTPRETKSTMLVSHLRARRSVSTSVAYVTHRVIIARIVRRSQIVSL